jgi:hypothetical protein
MAHLTFLSFVPWSFFRTRFIFPAPGESVCILDM